MAHRWRETIHSIRTLVRAMLGEQKYEKLHYISRVGEVFSRTQRRNCPICGYQGFFLSYGLQNRPEAICPECGSLERHRLIWLALAEHENCSVTAKDILHFAPEKCLKDLIKRTANRYFTIDLLREDVDLKADVANIPFPRNTFDLVICNEVLQYIPDDFLALNEIFRILRPQGVAIITVTTIDGWENTFEDSKIEPSVRYKYYGYSESLRLYGRDFAPLTESVGFKTEIFQPEFYEHITYGIIFGEKAFICRKPG